MQHACVIGLILSFVAGLATAAPSHEMPRPEKEWTFLFYVAGDEPDIDPWERVSLRRLEGLGSDGERWLVAHADLNRGDDGKATVSEPARRYEIGKFPGPIDPKNYETLKLKSPVVWQSAAETNSASPESLRDFLAWGIARYPARHYALFFLTHGWGWRGLAQDFNPGVALPASPPGTDIKYLMMSLPEITGALRAALPKGRKLDIVGMDSCNMGVLEFAYELKDLAGLFIAAVTEMPYMGFRYEATLSHPWRGKDVFARELATETIRSFARGGDSVALEGNYPPLAIFAMDLEKAGPFFAAFGSLTASLKGSNFADLFLRDRNPLWQDAAHNADLVELTDELARKSNLADVRDRAGALRALLGDEVAPDEAPVELAQGTADQIRVTFQGDEHGDEKERLKEAQETFDVLNPHLKGLQKKWDVVTKPEGRAFVLTFPPVKEPSVRIRPHLGGTSWALLEPLRGGKPLSATGVGVPQTYFLRTRFAPASPYLVAGHTFGAGRNHGIGVNIDDVVDPTQASNWHYAAGQWIGGKDYYRTIPFARAFGWADLLFQ